MAESISCWNCFEPLADVPLPISRHANCASCFEVLHCCRMCRHYLPNKAPYCDEDRAEPPSVKETANFCEYFEPVNRLNTSDAERSGKAKSALDNLFGGADHQPASDSEFSISELEGDETDDPLNKFNGLFDD